MRDVLPEIDRWIERGERFAIAIVTETWGSSPRPIGSALAVSERGFLVGSVSGGCVEGEVINACERVIKSRVPEKLTFESVSQDEIWKIGLSCGGQIEVWVFPGWEAGRAADDPWLQAADCVRKRLATEILLQNPDGGESFRWELSPPERLVIVGGVHIAIPLIAMARELGFETLVIEPRAALASLDRFAIPPDQVITEWPGDAFREVILDSNTYVVTLTHDPKIDDVAIRICLRQPVAYLGALGSRTTHAQRKERLLADGFTVEEVERIRGPVGLAIGAKTPAEIALSILAEMIQVRRAT